MSHMLFGQELLGLLVLGVLGIAIILAGIRLVLGPTVTDRIMAFDFIVVITMGKIATISILVDQWVFLDAVIILALLAFLATVALARYLLAAQKQERRWPR